MNIESFFTLSYGLYIVSSTINKKPVGYIGNTSFQVTAEPAQLAISCSKDNYSIKALEENAYFSVSVLKQEASNEIISTFGYKSSKDIDKFEKTKHHFTENNCPVVTQDSIAWFECKVVKTLDVGTHILFIAEVLNADKLSNEKPLTYDYYRSVKKLSAPKNAPTYVDKNKTEQAKEISTKKEGKEYRCAICNFVYNEAEGIPDQDIAPGTKFEDLPEDWVCPICTAGTDAFVEI